MELSQAASPATCMNQFGGAFMGGWVWISGFGFELTVVGFGGFRVNVCLFSVWGSGWLGFGVYGLWVRLGFQTFLGVHFHWNQGLGCDDKTLGPAFGKVQESTYGPGA